MARIVCTSCHILLRNETDLLFTRFYCGCSFTAPTNYSRIPYHMLFHCLYFSYFCDSVVAVSAGYFRIKRILYCTDPYLADATVLNNKEVHVCINKGIKRKNYEKRCVADHPGMTETMH